MLILLDIDGVMVPAKSWQKPELLKDGFPSFSSKSVSALQKIISETDSEIVLTSTHKSSYSIEEWKNIFLARGITVKNISRLPDNNDFLTRKEEIMKWVIMSKELLSFIIIDDDKSLNTLPEFLKNKLVQPYATIGLTEELANEALQIIEKEKFTIA